MLLFLIAANAVLVGGILYYERLDMKKNNEFIFEMKMRALQLERQQGNLVREMKVAFERIEKLELGNKKSIGNGKKSLLDRAGIGRKGPRLRPRT